MRPTPPLLLPRRALLKAGGALLAAPALLRPALAQNEQGRFAQWMQWTQIIGPDWGLRNATTIRAFPQQQSLLCLKWTIFPSNATTLVSIPDPSGMIAMRLFRLYNDRPDAPLAESHEVLEDFCWLENNRLTERVWTQALDSAKDTWETITTSPYAETLALPETSTLVWIQPTRDVPVDGNTQSIDLNGPNSDIPLSKLLQDMLTNDLFVAVTKQPRELLLEGTEAGDPETAILVRLPQSVRPVFPALYLRLLTTPTP